MKVSLHHMSLCLFWWVQVYLDLDTGETYNAAHDSEEIASGRHRLLKIPRYNQAVIYQRYLEMARDQGELDVGDILERYPRFELAPDLQIDNAEAFFKEADDLCRTVNDSSTLEFADYHELFALQVARDWCTKEGLEWEEDWPPKERHPLTLTPPPYVLQEWRKRAYVPPADKVMLSDEIQAMLMTN